VNLMDALRQSLDRVSGTKKKAAKAVAVAEAARPRAVVKKRARA
jgi:non-homologous end joining protein Ku